MVYLVACTQIKPHKALYLMGIGLGQYPTIRPGVPTIDRAMASGKMRQLQIWYDNLAVWSVCMRATSIHMHLRQHLVHA